ncbi:hypothetical protein Hanom_Chr16g01467031 [Helianthus anomalus]
MGLKCKYRDFIVYIHKVHGADCIVLLFQLYNRGERLRRFTLEILSRVSLSLLFNRSCGVQLCCSPVFHLELKIIIIQCYRSQYSSNMLNLYCISYRSQMSEI